MAPSGAAPTQTGLPTGVVDIPAVQLPAVPLSLGQGIGEGIGQLGGQLAQTGRQLQRDEERYQLVAARVQQAEAKTQALLGKNQYESQFDTLYADEKLKGDPSTLPQRMRDHDQRLRQQIGQGLSPQARQQFELEAGQRFSVVHRDAEHYRVTSTLKAGEGAVDEALALYQRRMVGNTNPEEVSQLTVSILKTFQDFEGLGVIPRGDGGRRFRVAQEAIQDEEVDRTTAADPRRNLTHLLDLQRGGAGDPGLPVPSPLKLAEKIDKARQQARALENEQEQAERSLETRASKVQDQTEIAFQTRITELTPSLETVGQYEGLLREVNASAGRGGISREGQQRLDTTIRTLRNAAQNPPERDDPKTERDLTILVQVAENPTDFLDVRTAVIASAGKLKGSTLRTLLNEIENRSRSNHWSNLPGVKAGRQILVGGDVSEGVTLPILRAGQKEAEGIRLRHALDAYTARVRALAEGTEGRPGSATTANSQAPEIALEIRRAFIDEPSKEAELKRLPLPLQGEDKQGIRDRGQAWEEIKKLQLPDAASKRLYDQWEAWWRRATILPIGTQRPQAPAAGTGGRGQKVRE